MSHAPIAPFSPDPDRDFDIRTTLGLSVEGAAEPGEVLAATGGIRKSDHDGWCAAWKSLAERTAAVADAARAGGHPVTAAGAYLRASTYFGVAVNALGALPDSPELAATFARQRAAWEAFVALTPGAERVDIPFEDGALPGYVFRPAGAAPDGRLPALVAVNGSDGSLAALFAVAVSPALKRGYAVLVFDGPGQQSQLFEAGTTFRPDWENVLTPVYDFMAAQPGVDPDRMALYGISQGGYWVSRALVVEHRFAAAIADPGVVDVSASWTSHLPKSLLSALDRGETEKFDREMALGMRFSGGVARTWEFRARPYGTTGYAETLEAVRTYRVTAEEAARITTPLLITDPEGEQFWPAQSERLAADTASVSTLVRFTTAQGADGHCEPLARTQVAQAMFDWLDTRLGR